MTPGENQVVVDAVMGLEAILLDGISIGTELLPSQVAPYVEDIEAAILPQIKNLIANYLATNFPTK